MKKLLLIAFVFLILLSCTKSESNFLKEISGVWRAQQDGSMVTINHDNNKMMLAIGDNVIPVTVGAIDKDNKTVNLNVILATGKPGVWTLRQIWDKEHKTFHLVFTLHDGTQDDLTFVRTISTDDLNRFASAPSTGKTVNESASNATKAQPEAPAPAVPVTEQPQVSGQIAWAPSFDCAKVSTGPERLICSNKELSEADVKLSQAYKAALNVSSNKETLKEEQNSWRKNERDACADVTCMTKVYQQRISQLSR